VKWLSFDIDGFDIDVIKEIFVYQFNLHTNDDGGLRKHICLRYGEEHLQTPFALPKTI